jgi:hypothetical protein
MIALKMLFYFRQKFNDRNDVVLLSRPQILLYIVHILAYNNTPTVEAIHLLYDCNCC